MGRQRWGGGEQRWGRGNLPYDRRQHITWASVTPVPVRQRNAAIASILPVSSLPLNEKSAA